MRERLRFLLTRTDEGNRRWAEAIRSRGHEPLSLRCLETAPITEPNLAIQFRAATQRASWLAFTSAYGVHIAADLIGGQGSNVVPRLAAVGPATTEAVRERFGRCDLSAGERGSAATLAYALLDRVETEDHVVVGIARDGRHELDQTLARGGVSVERIEIYQTIPCESIPTKQDLGEWSLDAIFLASPSALAGLLAQARFSSPLITIGPTTSEACRSAGLTVAAEATSRHVDSMIEAATCHLQEAVKKPH